MERVLKALEAVPKVTIDKMIWYMLLATVVWLIFYVMLRRLMQSRKVVQRFPTWKQMGGEVLLSLRSMFVFGLAGGFMVFMTLSGWSQVYPNVDDYGWPWFVLSIVLMIFLHDAYFYWTHRLMHLPKIFKTFHRVHHLSTNPSPWAAYSFSTLEAFVQAGIGPLAILVMPVHKYAFALFMLWQISFNVFGHCGYEIFPHWFLQSWFGYFLNSITHHAMHHESFRSNYGLYFNIWDRLMGTNNHRYEERFARVTSHPNFEEILSRPASPPAEKPRPYARPTVGAGFPRPFSDS